MQSVLVDSSFYIHRMRRRIDPFVELEFANDRFDFYSCGIVKTEVCRGVTVPRLYRQARERFEIMFWISTGDAIWDKALEISCLLGRQGINMQLTDLIIAASALSVDASVLTLDNDFHYVPDLHVIHDLV